MTHHLKESAFLLSILVAVYLVACLFTYSPTDPGPFSTTNSDIVQNAGRILGAWLADAFLGLTGYIAYLLPVITVYGGWRVWKKMPQDSETGVMEAVAIITGLILFLLSATGLSDMHLLPPAGSMPANGGGVIGAVVASPLMQWTGMLGSTLFLFSMMLVGVTLFTGLSWFLVMDVTGRITLDIVDWLVKSIAHMRDWFAGRRARAKRDVVRKTDSARQKDKKAPKIEPAISLPNDQPSKRVAKEKQRPLFNNMPADSLPPLDMLDEPHDQLPGYSEDALKALSKQVELKLADFGVQVDVVAVHPGPVITRFELEPAPGVKSAQIMNLAKDLARGLSIVSVRVVEVIPGKSTIGLEIPNTNRQMVFLSEILRSSVYDKASAPLTLALGKSISGRPIVANLAKMPHLLVAGTTGSGKSVALNAMILSILYKSSPEEVRLVMVDPKMLELSIYADIPHLLAPVVTDMKEAANALRWCVAEMERRYRLMSAEGVRNLAGFNKKIRQAREAGKPLKDPLFTPDEMNPDEEAPDLEHLPFIVVIVDELADMMMILGKKIDELIARLAQKARASGIHLILATQRPSVDVITGLIKANIPTRIAFQVSSRVDSRTILDQMGAEQLLGHGDMLYMPPGTAIPERVHGAFVDDHEVHAVVNYIKSLGEPNYVDEILEETQMTTDGMTINASGIPKETPSDQDELYDEAVAWVTTSRKASISSVQRHLRVGYNRAARLIEEMEASGVVSMPEHNGQREVLAPPPPRD
ncbi:MAG: DNA translocase FtsK 4TM domain-containing protein [Gammaproteobacteria bacterium]|nr:DNA translocase FtsK 4TM domain-containing protein [Gammaproteobacteria bacterium]NNK97528.1 cell division protein FtsK [Xanthomonadales bacterium]